MADFYITIPSNSSKNNTLNNFLVHLSRRIELVGDWEVALVQLQYPYSWFNVTEQDNNLTIISNEKKHTFTIPNNHYSSITQLITSINDMANKFLESTEQLTYSTHSGRVAYDIKPNESLIVGEKIMYMLGFDSRNLKDSSLQLWENDVAYAVSVHPPDMSAGLYSLYLYCSIVAPQLVGTGEYPLLQVVNISGTYGEYVEKEYTNPQYVPVLQKQFDRIEINIKNDSGNFIPFKFGKIVAKLHFRKKRR